MSKPASLVLGTNDPRRQAELSWQATAEAPREMSLEDKQSKVVIPRQAGRYVFTMGAPVRSFTGRVSAAPGRNR